MKPDKREPQFDEAALICAYDLDGKGSGILLDAVSIENQPGVAFSWFHFRSDSPNAPELMGNTGIDSRVIDALTADESRPRAMLLAGGALVVLRGVNTNPGADPEDMVSIRLWFNENIVVSSRRRQRKLLSIEDIRSSIKEGTGPKTTGEFVALLTERMAFRIGDVVDQIDDELTAIEASIGDAHIADIRKSLSLSRRQSAAIRRYLAPQRVALDTLFRDHRTLSDQDAHALHLQTDRITRYVEDLDLARERALVLQGELQDRIAEEQNQRMYVLSIVAAIFLPLSFLTGVFGMNVAGLPGTENPNSFLSLTGSMLLVGVVLIGFMRWKKWL